MQIALLPDIAGIFQKPIPCSFNFNFIDRQQHAPAGVVRIVQRGGKRYSSENDLHQEQLIMWRLPSFTIMSRFLRLQRALRDSEDYYRIYKGSNIVSQ